MDILFLTQVLPYPLVGGAKIRAYYMLRYLAQHHRVTLVSFVRDDDRPEDVAHLASFCAAVHTQPMRRSRLKDAFSLVLSLLRRQPAVIIRDHIPHMEALLARLVGEQPFDVVHADQTAMAAYGLYARDLHPAGEQPALVLDQHNALYLLVERQAALERGLMRLVWQREARLLRRYEQRLCRQYDQVLTVTEEDRRLLQALVPDKGPQRFTAIPICVDPQEQPPVAPVAAGPHILHLGTMFWPPNVEGVLWFAREVLPLVLAEVPDAFFTIAGKNPPPEVEALAQPGSPLAGHVEVTGFVEDPLPLLARSRVFIVPVRAGGGMRVKIVDGWQWALPIVSTTIGAEGVETRPGENILLADDPAAFATAVVRILQDEKLAAGLRENGRRWVETHYNWRTVYQQVGTVYARLAQGR